MYETNVEEEDKEDFKKKNMVIKFDSFSLLNPSEFSPCEQESPRKIL